ncbi:hypothetical protein KI387_013055, partial [Taxus chinensis]
GLSAVNIISNSAGQFLLHKEMKDQEARVVSLQLHIHALTHGVKFLSHGLVVVVENQGLYLPEKAKVDLSDCCVIYSSSPLSSSNSEVEILAEKPPGSAMED